MEKAHLHVQFLGMTVDLTVIAMSLLVSIIVALLALAAVKHLDMRHPRGMQNFFEWLTDFIKGLAKDTIGERAETYVPLGLTLIIWMFVSNQMGLITNIVTKSETGLPQFGVEPGQEIAWFMSPTANISVAMAMGIAMVLYSHGVGLRKPGQYLKHYVSPAWMLPIHLIEELPKFLTLGLRLFGNIFAGEVLIAIILQIPILGGWFPVGAIPMFIWLAYSLFVGTIQAFVFTVLTLVYIGQKVPHENH
ncbi:ATP synthase subunit a [Collibacillus ludicampi]|jgi:F-type H+-transporting ATPase subunit a|uniref:ATP synthase subunit a n=1 Tax=Collibacillus ludicampi TaxID=2771369 RepID=A0AAV4LD75_9BACL|nr:F0F1 ATP synthase subunit A [Collibacillus ludicampi]GIM45706.1 ATP synthase subunit a [Collibacillus ludicampi]